MEAVQMVAIELLKFGFLFFENSVARYVNDSYWLVWGNSFGQSHFCKDSVQLIEHILDWELAGWE
eukprot:5281535-Amphidinium_carterae.1